MKLLDKLLMKYVFLGTFSALDLVCTRYILMHGGREANILLSTASITEIGIVKIVGLVLLALSIYVASRKDKALEFLNLMISGALFAQSAVALWGMYLVWSI